jgi:hypothetical protein
MFWLFFFLKWGVDFCGSAAGVPPQFLNVSQFVIVF